MFDSIHEECGIFGIYEKENTKVASSVYYGLYALQHRGQESCGIAVCKDGLITQTKGFGLVNDVFNKDNILPKEILMRDKAAFSDAVGHSMVDYLKSFANKLYNDDEFVQLSNKYTHSKPFTKESLLYREIFEKYYPNQSEMVKDFWMPNKNWEGCNVNDPSARVLSNYGNSGK